MTNKRQQQTLARLQQLGLLNTAMTDNTVANEADDDSPWFLQLFFGFSGFLASLFFIGFLSLGFEQLGVLDNSATTFIIGLLLSGISSVLFRRKTIQRSAFLTSLTFAISIAGQLYITFAFFGSGIDFPLNVWVLLVIQILLTIIMPNFIYRLLSIGAALSCIIYLLGYYQASEAGLALLALITVIASLQNNAVLEDVPTKWRLGVFELSRTIAYASAFMLLIFSTFIVASEYGNGFIAYVLGYQDFIYNYILAQVLLTLVSLYGVSLILQRYKIKLLAPTSLIIACAIIVLGAISVYVSGLLATSLVIIIATANSQRILLGLGIAALVGYIFWYYYQLDTSLLIKSFSMLVIGVIMLLMRWLLVKRYFADTKNNTQERLL